jgi:hypothetical protein
MVDNLRGRDVAEMDITETVTTCRFTKQRILKIHV